VKISIITVTFNSARTISDCISSVNSQTYENIEHIIIDGASVDNTVDIIRFMENRVSKIVSEPDEGIYYAMNKGIAEATGQIVGILNSDDFYVKKTVLSEIASCFQNNDVDCVFGNINYVKSQKPEKIIRRWQSGCYKRGSFQRGWHPAHPAFFTKKSVYDRYGIFNLNFKLAADFELMLRILEKYGISNFYIEDSLINMRLGGATSRSLINIIKQNIECYKAFRVNSIDVSPLYFLYRLLPKLKQFIK